MGNARKKVILRTLADVVQPGYLPSAGLLDAGGDVALLDLEGRLQPVALSSVRWIAYVRDFNLGDRTDPERLSRRTFLARPRSAGLWLRLTLLDDLVLEGLAAADLSLVDAMAEDRGVFLTPPDIRSNTQRLFVPRGAFKDLAVLAVITTPSKTPPVAQSPPSNPAQDRLFL